MKTKNEKLPFKVELNPILNMKESFSL